MDRLLSMQVFERVVDAGGFNRTVRFTRPSGVLAWATVTVVYDAARYAGDAAVKAAAPSPALPRLTAKLM